MNEPNPRMSLEHMLVNGYTLNTIERQVRKWAVLKVLNEENGHQLRSAARLGVHRNTLTRIVQDLGIKLVKDGRYTNGPQSIHGMRKPVQPDIDTALERWEDAR